MGEVGFRVGSKAKFTQSESHCRIPHVARKWLIETQKPRANLCAWQPRPSFCSLGRKARLCWQWPKGCRANGTLFFLLLALAYFAEMLG